MSNTQKNGWIIAKQKNKRLKRYPVGFHFVFKIFENITQPFLKQREGITYLRSILNI